MKKPVPEFIKAKNEVMRYFGCEEEIFIKPVTSYKWQLTNNGGMFFIGYFKEGESAQNSVVVKKEDKPLLFEKGDYSLLVCIECVKVGLIFKNENRLEDINL